MSDLRGYQGEPPAQRRSQPQEASGEAAAPPPRGCSSELLRAAASCWPCAARSTRSSWSRSCSDLVGAARRGPPRATVEQLVGEGLVDYAGEQAQPGALALLSGIACLGTSGRRPRPNGGAGAVEPSRPAGPALGLASSAVRGAHPDSLSDLDMRTLCYVVMARCNPPHGPSAPAGAVPAGATCTSNSVRCPRILTPGRTNCRTVARLIGWQRER